mmetsp:Transcript_8166/g.9486  ORF Transcript_8166/g.9486 Transcript_8166/m.9486 type:complete len:128 (-) Transcript_8166:350-733(-)
MLIPLMILPIVITDANSHSSRSSLLPYLQVPGHHPAPSPHDDVHLGNLTLCDNFTSHTHSLTITCQSYQLRASVSSPITLPHVTHTTHPAPHLMSGIFEASPFPSRGIVKPSFLRCSMNALVVQRNR